MVRVLFVCLGNICRSPTAEGVFRKLVRDEKLEHLFEIDSAGTHAYHIGEPPDERARAACARRGIDIGRLRGRKAVSADIEKFDYVLAMDRENYEDLRDICPPGHEARIRLFMEFAADRPEQEVPDPYFGGASGFDRVLDMIEDAARGLLADIRRTRL
jgi:low molecular weight protein-tyrosine phosphatase